jgi:hypothetical protein
VSNAGDGARIKVYPGAVPGSNSTSSGGGVGIVRNVTYNGMHDTGVDCEHRSFSLPRIYFLTQETDAIELTQCYSQSNATLCNMYPVSRSLPCSLANTLLMKPNTDIEICSQACSSKIYISMILLARPRNTTQLLGLWFVVIKQYETPLPLARDGS